MIHISEEACIEVGYLPCDGKHEKQSWSLSASYFQGEILIGPYFTCLSSACSQSLWGYLAWDGDTLCSLSGQISGMRG